MKDILDALWRAGPDRGIVTGCDTVFARAAGRSARVGRVEHRIVGGTLFIFRAYLGDRKVDDRVFLDRMAMRRATTNFFKRLEGERRKIERRWREDAERESGYG